MSNAPLPTLVLAGTAEARAVIDGLKDDSDIALTASLAGARDHCGGHAPRVYQDKDVWRLR